ncbi:MAG TPA: UvrD-helicase domain-containing protein, partial [Byssovorax sp.]
RVDPLFEVIAEDEAERLFDVAFDRWFQDALAAPLEGTRRMLRKRPRGRDRVGPRDVLRDAAWKLVGHRDFPTPLRRDDFDRDPFIERVLARLTEAAKFADRADREDDWLAKNLQKLARFLDELARREAVRARDYDGLEAELAEIARWKEWKYTGGRGQSYGRGIKRADVRELRDAAKAELDLFVAAANADLAACLQVELAPIAERYAASKQRVGRLDFLDLLLRSRDLVRGDAAVRAELQRRTSHLFVDEFQDTDPLQAEILLLLAADDPKENVWSRARPIPGKLFLVGDPKQSIYRFRRADVALYQSVKERLLAHGAKLLHLVTSFRGAPSIQSAVNAAFAPVMKATADGSQAEYAALMPFREDTPGQPSVVALSIPRPYSPWGKVTSWSIEESLPDAVGAFVDWLVHHSGFRVSERGGDGALVPVEARHVCLLFKRLQSFGEDATRRYVRALEARRIPHVLVGGRSFHEREEVLAVENALAAIEWPDDDLAVYATLRGPFFALSDEALLAYKDAARSFSPLHPIPGRIGRSEEVAELTELTRGVAVALATLRGLHFGRNRRPFADTVARLLETTRAHAGVAIWPTGEQSLANVLRVMDLARRFEAGRPTSFRAFVERLQADAESGQAGEAPVVEEGTEGVRIMTAHKAKGLEFPVVILADPTTPTLQGNPPQPSRFVDGDHGLWAEAIAGLVPAELAEHAKEVLRRDREEAARLTYVAATRARDLLVVPACGDEEIEGWLDVMNPALYPAREDYRAAEEAPGCPPFGEDSVLSRPDKVERGAWSSVMPGQHAPRVGDHRVVWWDPSVLELDKEPTGGLRQQHILQADDAKTRSTEGQVMHAAWRARADETRALGATPTLPTTTATAFAADAALPVIDDLAELAASVLVEHTDTPRDARPHGKRFGTLVHAVLAEVDLAADADRVRVVAIAQGRLAKATPAEVDAAAEAAIGALAHPLMRRAREADLRGACRREVPVLLPLEGGAIVEGVVDLCFEDDGAWTVVDFKTDVEVGERGPIYARQVALYAVAIARATGERASGALLSV